MPPPPAEGPIGTGMNVPFPSAIQPAYSALDFRKDFFFRRRHGALDWNRLRQVDLERVVRTVDVDALQENVEHITFADITEQDLAQLTDANFLQLFRLTQLIIEYLLNVQNFLLASAKKKESTYEQVLADLEATRAALNERTESERAAKKELKYCRRVIKAYERNLGARHETAGAPPPCKCAMCGSVFVSHDFLVGHYRRRHPNEEPPKAPVIPQAQQIVVTSPQQPPDLAAWKREMEAALRAQLQDSQRSNSRGRERGADKKEPTETESELAAKLAKLEATLAAVLNNNTLPAAAVEPSPMQASRAGQLRDDDGGARLQEDAGSLKEYLRRELFDLREEVAGLREESAQARQDQAYFAPYHAPHEPAAAGAAPPIGLLEQHQQQTTLPLSELSPASHEHARELLQRFRSSPPAYAVPHPPTHPQPHQGIPQGTGFVPRHQPTQPHLTPQPPPPRQPLLPSDPKALKHVRETLLKRHEKVFTLFPDLPGLLSRFKHPEADLLGHLNSFSVLANTLAQQGGLQEVEDEMRGLQGCAEIYPETEVFVEEYVRRNYQRSPELLEAFKAVAERERRFEALGSSKEAREAYARAHRDAWLVEKARLDRERAEAEALAKREEEERRRAFEQDWQARQAEQVRLQELAAQAVAMSPTSSLGVPQGNNPRPPPLSTALSPSPSPLPILSSIPGPSPSPVSSASLSPSPYPSMSPIAEQSPSASPTVGQGQNYSSYPAQSPAVQQPALPPSSFSNDPNILNPSATTNSVAAQPQPATIAKQPSVAASSSNPVPANNPRSILKKTPAIRHIKAIDEFDDADDEFEQPQQEEEKKLPETVARQPTGTVNTAAAADQSVSGKPNLFSPPPAVPVPIPARPNKAAIAALSSGRPNSGGSRDMSDQPPIVADGGATVAASAAPAVAVPAGPNDVEAFVAEPPTPIAPKRVEGRRLSNATEDPDAAQDADLTMRRTQTRNGSITQPAGEVEHDTQYEHSSARQDLDADDGLEREYAQREQERVEQQQGQMPQGEDDVHHFSPPASSPIQTKSGQGRLHSDDEGDGPPGPLTSRIPQSVQAPPLRTRNMGDLRNIQPGHSRFGTGTSQSTNFSVASSGDWKSDADILDDDVEELIA